MSEDRFIPYLHALKHEDTGTLARCRRACGERWPGPCPEQGQFEGSPMTLATDFLSLTLAAQYKSETIKTAGLPSTTRRGQRAFWPFRGEGNIGAAWAEYCRKKDPYPNDERTHDPHKRYRKRQEALAKGHAPPNIPSIHERFRTLLDAELELDGTGELAYRLRGLVRMLVAEDVPIDVIQLAWDLRQWRCESRHVQESWARAFYAPAWAATTGDATVPDAGAGVEELEPDEQETDDDAD